jgi:hypothetical protein
MSFHAPYAQCDLAYRRDQRRGRFGVRAIPDGGIVPLRLRPILQYLRRRLETIQQYAQSIEEVFPRCGDGGIRVIGHDGVDDFGFVVVGCRGGVLPLS